MGLTKPKKVTLRSGLVGVWKSENKDSWFGSYKSEIAAYQVDKLLGLDIVPLTVEREIDEKKGSLQLWVYGMSKRGGIPLSDDAKFFVKVIGKNDIHTSPSGKSHNYGFIRTNNGSRVILFDNGEAFFTFKKTRLFDGSSLQPTESLLENVRQLNMNQLNSIPHLTEKQKRALLRRCYILMKNRPRTSGSHTRPEGVI